LWNRAAAEQSVDDCPCVKQIGKWSEAGFAMFGAGVRPLVSDFNRFPIGPAGRDERSAAIGKYCKQQQNTAEQVMANVSGAHHYEERMLCLLLLLRMPRTQVIYVTSTPIPQTIIDYYLHLLPGIPGLHARRRLTLVSCDDASPVALTRKILERPRVLERLRQAIPDPASAHMTCFTVTELERKLALRLNLPIYGCDPSLLHWGSKSGSRKIFREAGVALPLGFEDLSDAGDVARAIAELKAMKPDLRKAVVKINEGFSGEGNAVFDLTVGPAGPAPRQPTSRPPRNKQRHSLRVNGGQKPCRTWRPV
jgi:hypothetical protein